jgi:para-nitrobenzyl esterase
VDRRARRTTAGSPSCQSGKSYFGIDEPEPDENCLFLNVWTPAADGRKRPVMFFHHGGGFTTGSGGSVDHDGGNLARNHDVVVVETNHRLGLLGYLYLGELGGEEYTTSGNQGLLDMRDGLHWVYGNIQEFGGDPNNVMIFGESGGGAKTSGLYALPSASMYCNKAAIESGAGLRMMERNAAAKDVPAWPAYTTGARATMMIDAECKVEKDPFSQERILWSRLKSQ